MSTRHTQVLARLWVILAMLLGATAATPSNAIASGCDANAALGNFAPDSGVIYAHKLTGNRYSASMSFELTTTQVANLRCLGPFVEIDFKLYGFNLPATAAGWQGYRVQSNLQGAIADQASIATKAAITPKIRISSLRVLLLAFIIYER